MNVLGIIPARGGSKRLPGKNLMLLAGMSLLERTIRQAQEVGFAECTVSTEDTPITVAANRFGMAVTWRPERLASDSASTEDVITFHLLSYHPQPWFCLLQVTSPLRTVDDIRACIELAQNTDRPVVSTCNGKRNGAVYVGKTWPPGHDYFAGATNYEMPPERSVDIDTLEDFNEAERIINATEIRATP